VRTDGPQIIADLFAAGFADPRLLVPVITNTDEAKRVIGDATGRHWLAAAARGAVGVAASQVRQRIAALRA
jgi:hypothetical protein